MDLKKLHAYIYNRRSRKLEQNRTKEEKVKQIGIKAVPEKTYQF